MCWINETKREADKGQVVQTPQPLSMQACVGEPFPAWGSTTPADPVHRAAYV